MNSIIKDTPFIPKGYTRVQYLRNAGNARIDTGIKNHKHWGMGCIFTAHRDGGWFNFNGSRTGIFYSMGYSLDANGLRANFDYDVAGTLAYTNAYRPGKAAITKWECKPNMATEKMDAYLNDRYIMSYALPTDVVQSVNAWVYYGNNDYRSGEQSIYRFWLTDENGNPVIDLIPIAKDNIGYMYDLVSKQIFENANPTSSAFVIGPTWNFDKETSFVEYIECNGYQWFDSQIVPDNTIECEVVFMPLDTYAADSYLFGSVNSTNNSPASSYYSLTIRLNGKNIGLRDINYSSAMNNTALSYNTIHKAEIKQRGLYVDDNLLFQSPSTDSFEHTGSCGILHNHFNNYNWNTSRSSTLRLYSVKIWKSGELVRDCVPYRWFDSVCLWDKVDNIMIPNGGTRNGVLGPDI